MLISEDFLLTKNEKRMRKLWGTFLWLSFVLRAALLFCFLFFGVKYNVISAEKIEQCREGLAELIVGGPIGALMVFLCAYKSTDIWLLRLYHIRAVWLCIDGLLLVYLVSVALTPLGIKFLTGKAGISWSTTGIAAIVFSPLVFFEIFQILYFILSFKLIKINKKRKCKKFLSDQYLEKLSLFQKMPDGNDRSNLYNSLVSHLPQMSWLFKRVWERKKTLITNW